ncbi:MAG: ECF-type sigma factor [Pseudomonadota bacterium]
MNEGRNQTEPLTDVLERWTTASEPEKNHVIESLYRQLKQKAALVLAAGNDYRVVEPTVLVNEVYLKLVGLDRMNWQGRKHFLNVAAKLMRQVIIDIARREQAQKRGRDVRTEYKTVMDDSQQSASSILDIDAALTDLGKVDQQYVGIVEARIFAGLTIDETADALAISPATVKRKWKAAQLWLHDRLRSN